MSIISTVANYGGRINDFQQSVKQFVVGAPSTAIWIYKRLSDGLLVQTPANNSIPVLIDNDLTITGSLYNTSDARLKENVREISTENMENLSTLNPIIFNFKNNNKKIHYGFLAQDVEKKFPELVENNMLGYKTVNYQELIPLMLAKIKLIQEQIDELKQSKKSIS